MSELRLVKPIEILLVEDNPGDADLIGELLPRDGAVSFEVKHAARLSTALELLGAEHFDLVLLDLGLPDSVGLDTVRAVLRQAPDLPIVVVTGNDDEYTGLAAIREGAQDYMVKGHITGTLLSGVLRYSQERHQIVLQLGESEEHYRSLFENMPDGFASCQMLLDEDSCPTDFVYLVVNPAFERLTGLKDVVGRRITELVPDTNERSPELFESYRRVALTGRPEQAEFDSKWLGVKLAASIYSPAKGQVAAVFEDITARVQAEELLRQTQQQPRGVRETERRPSLRIPDRPDTPNTQSVSAGKHQGFGRDLRHARQSAPGPGRPEPYPPGPVQSPR
jgi:PAS domain S-box-containing protein